MANQVYETTHEGLSAVISAKAATQVLRKAIEAEGHNYKNISGSEMRDVLMGPVYQELTNILPKEGVERTLKQIIKNLKKQAKAAKAAKEKEAEEEQAEHAEISEEPANGGSAASVDHPEEIQESHAEEIPTPHAEEIAPQIEVVPFIKSTPQVTKLTSPVETTSSQIRIYSEEELSSFLMRFAQVENIKVVAIVQNNGTIKQSRGSGFDLKAISRIGSMGLKLLSRGRSIHSFYLAHQRGQLFLFPLSDHTLIVVGNSEVNVGEVFSTLSTLEESI